MQGADATAWDAQHHLLGDGHLTNHPFSATFPLEIAPALLAGHEFGDKQVVFIIPEWGRLYFFGVVGIGEENAP